MGYSRSATARGTGYHLHLLRRALAAVVEGFVEADELDLVPADPDTEPEPAAAQDVERRRLLRHQHRLALRQDQHADREADLPRAAGQKPEQHERVARESELRGVPE